MCGILGIIDRARPGPVRAAEQATRAMRHRGPDDEGFLVADWRSGAAVACAGEDTDSALDLPAVAAHGGGAYPALLAHRRLSILDVSPAGHQPMCAAGGALWITFNGEIYNYLELRAQLAALGHRFSTGTDTEVILAAYAEWGTGALNRFVGMFAFAILDLARRQLLLARDCFGIKPLYYAATETGLAFASEIGPLLDLPGVSRTADAQRVYDYLRFGHTDHGAGTMYAAVRQLPAAHYAVVDLAGDADLRALAPTRYWDVAGGDGAGATFEEASERVGELFLDSVRLHLRSDVPVGACLSGGIDSSAIVAGMRRVAGDALDLHTFTYLAEDPALNEERWANVVAGATRSRMHTVGASHAELAADLDRLIDVQGEPFGGTSIYAQHRVFGAAAAAGMKVMLDGQGADELFLGYWGFFNLRVGALLRRGDVPGAVRFARHAAARGAGFGSMLLRGGGRLAPARLQPALLRAMGRSLEPAWLGAGWFRRHGVEPSALDWSRGRDMLRHEAKRAFVETSLPSLLRFEDRNSMAYSIESRVPFLTPALASFAFSLPDEYLLSPQASTKAVLRQALRGLVPDPILDRRDKIGFATPQRAWLRALRPQIERLFASGAVDAVPALDPAAVRAAVRHTLDADAGDVSQLWRWYSLVRWAERAGVEFAA
jgi:asparagine synthase (glutamine-hydrolysing)